MTSFHEETLSASVEVLRLRYAGVDLELDEVVADYETSTNLILRCLARGLPGNAETVVIKRAKVAKGHLLTELAGHRFLGERPETQELVPGVLGFDASRELLVLKDLGPAKEYQLGWILLGEDAGRAEAGLLALQKAMGRLHGLTLGQAGVFAVIQEEFGRGSVSRHKIHEIVPALESLAELPELLGIRKIPELDQELKSAVLAITHPGPFHGFTHGDATPANAFLTPEGLRLFDLETCGFRHVLLDGAFARIRYVHSVWAFQIPRTMQERLISTYRSELSHYLPQADDDAVFHPALTACSAAWLGGLCRFIPDVWKTDKKWGRISYRQRVIGGLEHFVVLDAELNQMPACAELARKAKETLSALWPQEDQAFPIYPAFREI